MSRAIVSLARHCFAVGARRNTPAVFLRARRAMWLRPLAPYRSFGVFVPGHKPLTPEVEKRIEEGTISIDELEEHSVVSAEQLKKYKNWDIKKTPWFELEDDRGVQWILDEAKLDRLYKKFGLRTEQEKAAFMEQYKVSVGSFTLEWSLPSPPPYHTFNELPIIKEVELDPPLTTDEQEIRIAIHTKDPRKVAWAVRCLQNAPKPSILLLNLAREVEAALKEGRDPEKVIDRFYDPVTPEKFQEQLKAFENVPPEEIFNPANMKVRTPKSAAIPLAEATKS